MLSIIIPTLNEANALGETLDVVARMRGAVEVIVADGNSKDATVAIALQRGARVVHAPRGRGLQMHAGTRAAGGDVFWFLHADTHPTVDAVEHIEEALRRSDVIGGHFGVRFEGQSRAARFLTWFYRHAQRFGLSYGDSAIFVRRHGYEQVGGFQAFPLFEDLDLVRRLRPRGRFVRVPSTVVTSSRRFERRNVLFAFAGYVALQVLYWLGISPRLLGAIYKPIRCNLGRSTEAT